MLDRTILEFALTRLLLAMLFAALPLAVVAATSFSAATRWDPSIVTLMTVGGAAGGYAMGRAILASQAVERRRDFTAELATSRS